MLAKYLVTLILFFHSTCSVKIKTTSGVGSGIGDYAGVINELRIKKCPSDPCILEKDLYYDGFIVFTNNKRTYRVQIDGTTIYYNRLYLQNVARTVVDCVNDCPFEIGKKYSVPISLIFPQDRDFEPGMRRVIWKIKSLDGELGTIGYAVSQFYLMR